MQCYIFSLLINASGVAQRRDRKPDILSGKSNITILKLSKREHLQNTACKCPPHIAQHSPTGLCLEKDVRSSKESVIYQTLLCLAAVALWYTHTYNVCSHNLRGKKIIIGKKQQTNMCPSIFIFSEKEHNKSLYFSSTCVCLQRMFIWQICVSQLKNLE